MPTGARLKGDTLKLEVYQLILDETYRFNKTIATATIRFIVTVAIVVYKGSKLVVYRMLTEEEADQLLCRLYDEGNSISVLAEMFERTKGAIRSRLKKLGKIS